MTETIAFQAMVEGLRAANDAYDGSSEADERIELMEKDMLKAKASMEIAWLAATMNTSSPD